MGTSIEMKKVRKLLDNIPEDRKPIAESLYSELVFMKSTMEKLKLQVERDGAVDLFKQGTQEFWREHPALKAYNTTIQRYSLIYKQMVDLLPESVVKEEDELLEFIAK